MCPSLRIHGQRRCGIYAMEYYSTSKMKVSLSFPTTWMNHIHSEGYISEIRQTKEKKKVNSEKQQKNGSGCQGLDWEKQGEVGKRAQTLSFKMNRV